MNTNPFISTELKAAPLHLGKNYTAIFLDIEGVIVSHRTIIAHSDLPNGIHYHGGSENWTTFIDTAALGLIYRLAKDFSAKIVLTSTLRFKRGIVNDLIALRPSYVSSEEAIAMFSLGVTERLGMREDEITIFAKENGVTKYVVIDDRTLSIGNFVNVNQSVGFSYDDYQDSKVYLLSEGEVAKYESIFL